MSQMTSVFVLMVIFQFKHFIADYPLQGAYMLGKFKKKGWVLPLLAHVGVHGLFTAIIAAPINLALAIPLALLDMTLHFIMDRIKASPDMLGRYRALSKTEVDALIKPGAFNPEYVKDRFEENTYFWWSLGVDQMVHHLTDILIIFLLVTL